MHLDLTSRYVRNNHQQGTSLWGVATFCSESLIWSIISLDWRIFFFVILIHIGRNYCYISPPTYPSLFYFCVFLIFICLIFITNIMIEMKSKTLSFQIPYVHVKLYTSQQYFYLTEDSFIPVTRGSITITSSSLATTGRCGTMANGCFMQPLVIITLLAIGKTAVNGKSI